MAHEVEQMAFVGETPWHGLGERLTPGQDIDQWRIAAGLDWDVIKSPVLFQDEDGAMREGMGSILVRDSDYKPLGLVGDRYHVLQPGEVLEFYRSLTDQLGFQLETAGSLRGGQRIWALAKTGEEARLKGQDLLLDYVLLATSYDGSMATVASRTSVRVVCMNTFRMAVGDKGERADVKVPHHTKFDAESVKGMLGVGDAGSWDAYIENARALADRKVSKKEAVEFFLRTYYGVDEDGELVGDLGNKTVEKRMGGMLDIYEGGQGQQTASAKGTAWGLLNAVTRYEDHERTTRTQDNRLNSAWFGDGEKRKQAAMQEAMLLVA
jgi:phage/plasmid-like protein (TIGR03299 family)